MSIKFLGLMGVLCSNVQTFCAQTSHPVSAHATPNVNQRMTKLEKAIVTLGRRVDSLQEQQQVQARFSIDNAQALAKLQRASLSNNLEIQELQRENERLAAEVFSLIDDVIDQLDELQFDVNALKRAIQGQRGIGLRRSRGFQDQLERAHRIYPEGGWFEPKRS